MASFSFLYEKEINCKMFYFFFHPLPFLFIFFTPGFFSPHAQQCPYMPNLEDTIDNFESMLVPFSVCFRFPIYLKRENELF